MTAKQDVNLEAPGSFSRPGRLPKIWLGAGILLLGLLVVGLFFAPELTVWGLLGLGVGVPFALLVWFRPETGILALIFLTSSFVPADIFDVRLALGGGLDLRDLLLIGLFGLLLVRELSKKRLTIPLWRASGPLILFLILAIFSTVYAIAFQHIESNWALSDLRILSSYAVYFLVIWGLKRDNQLRWLLIGLFILADLTTVIIILQQFAGANNPLLHAMMTTQDWQVFQEAGGGVRVIPAGQILMHFMWFIALGLLVFAKLSSRQKLFMLFQILFIGAGHIMTYMRSQWIAMFIGFGLILLVLVVKHRKLIPRYITLGFAVILVMALLWGTTELSNILNTPALTGVKERFASILTPGETLESSSLVWRQFENGRAVESILKNPLWGVGLGGHYRELTTLQGEADGLWTRNSLAAGEVSRFTRYVHNSYLSIAVKMGIPGLAALLWFLIAFLISGWKIYRDLPDSDLKGIVLGVLAGFVGLLAWSYFHAHLIKAESTPAIGLMAGLVVTIPYLYKHDRAVSDNG